MALTNNTKAVEAFIEAAEQGLPGQLCEEAYHIAQELQEDALDPINKDDTNDVY